MNKIKINLILINFFFSFFFTNTLEASSNFFIIAKVDNEIITNIDVLKEVNYLIALNNDLKKIDKKSLINLAQNSLIREKIKKNELDKYKDSLKVKKDILENIIKNYYNKLNINNLRLKNFSYLGVHSMFYLF